MNVTRSAFISFNNSDISLYSVGFAPPMLTLFEKGIARGPLNMVGYSKV